MRKSLCFSLLAILFSGCAYDSIEKPATVIIGGYERNYTNPLHPTASTLLAKYWKNGSGHDVTTAAENHTLIRSIAISGKDIYMAGTQNIGGKYWKNSTEFSITDCSDAKSITVSGNDVYIGGTDMNGNASLWKNGVPYPLETVPFSGYSIVSVVVDGSDVYCAANAVVWKNGKVFQSQLNLYIISMAVVKGELYLGGWTYFNTISGPVFNAAFWKNGSITNIFQGPFESAVNSIAVVGSDVYLAGYTTYGLMAPGTNLTTTKACYWKNKQWTDLGNGKAQALAVDGKDIHIVGSSDIGATYWKNGVPSLIGAPASDTSIEDTLVGIALMK